MSRNIVTTERNCENGKFSKQQPGHFLKEAEKIKDNIENLQKRNMCCIKTSLILLITLLCLPFSITSIYYAFTDTSCVNQQAGNLYINLKDFLAVDGILILIYYLFICLFIIFSKNPLKTGINITNNIIYRITYYIYNIFSLVWTIVGAVIFWSLIDNKQCNKPIYNYTVILLVLEFIASLLSQFDNKKI